MSGTNNGTICDIAFNTVRPRPNGDHFPDDIFRCIFVNENENVYISIKISLKFVPKHLINNNQAFVQILVSEPLVVRLSTDIWITRHQRVKLFRLLMTWRCKEPRHQPELNWLISHGKCQCKQQKGCCFNNDIMWLWSFDKGHDWSFRRIE